MDYIEVAAAIIRDKDKVLITRRALNENFGGGWEFPGGKIEAGETAEKCIEREIKEELGLLVAAGNFCESVNHSYDNINIKLSAYFCKILEGEIKLSVHDKYKWVEVEDLLKYNLLPADIPIAKKIKRVTKENCKKR